MGLWVQLMLHGDFLFLPSLKEKKKKKDNENCFHCLQIKVGEKVGGKLKNENRMQ